MLSESARIDQLIALGKKTPPVQYETVGTSYVIRTRESIPVPGAKVWQKGPYRKIAGSSARDTSTIITRPDGAYIYDAEKDRYIRHTKPNVPAEKTFHLLRRDKNSKLTIVGDEVIDGKECVIVQKVAIMNGDSATSKVWVWKKNGLPVRTEATMKLGPELVKIETDYKNFVFGDIPDSVFAVPKEKVIDAPSPN